MKWSVDRPDRQMSCGYFNVRSLLNNVNFVSDLRGQLALDVTFIIETWYDADSGCLRRLRTEGLEIDRVHQLVLKMTMVAHQHRCSRSGWRPHEDDQRRHESAKLRTGLRPS